VYTVRWDEETVIKWMAVAMVLGLLAMAVMPLAVDIGALDYYLYRIGFYPEWYWNDIKEIRAAIGLIGGGVAIISPPIGAAILIGDGLGYL